MDRRVTLVTGGASGIGREVARLLRETSHVIVADRDEDALANARADGFDTVRMDVADTDAWRKLSQQIRDEHGRLDGLVHNAGIAPIASLLDSDDAQLDRVYETNVRSILVGTRETWPLLVAARGAVVAIASVAALVGQDRSAAYVASKGAVVALTRALAIELAPHGVRVNSVCPGTTVTPLLEKHFASIPGGDQVRRHMEGRNPIGRLLAPADIAPTVVHLLSPETAAGITGSNFVVDGGLTATFDYGNSFSGGASDGD